MKKSTKLSAFLLLFYLLIFSIYPPTVHAQSVYDLSWKKDVPMLAGGMAGTTASLLLRAHHDPLTDIEIAQLNPNDINIFDRPAIQYYGEGAREASDVLLTLSYALPLTALLFQDTRSDVGTIGVLLAETLLLNEAFTGITKTLVERPRPYTYNPEVPETNKTENDSNLSFFSGHTSYTAALSFFSAKVITDHTDNRTVKIIAWTSAVLLPAATGYMRYRAGMHFPTDIITGYVIGASLGYLVPQLHKVKSDKKQLSHHISQFTLSPMSLRIVLVF